MSEEKIIRNMLEPQIADKRVPPDELEPEPDSTLKLTSEILTLALSLGGSLDFGDNRKRLNMLVVDEVSDKRSLLAEVGDDDVRSLLLALWSFFLWKKSDTVWMRLLRRSLSRL